MKITHIRIENFLGARAVDLDLAAPVALLAGSNGAGKSSVRDGIALALTADLGRVSLKKDAPQLITAGAESASVALQTSAGEVAVAISAGGRIADSLKGVELPPALPYVLDGQRFARMSSEDRRAFLFGLMGLSAGGDEVSKRLAARGCDAERVRAVLPMLRAGFDAAAKEAATKAREAKAAWREITGEAYGEKKADGWAPAAVPKVTDEQLDAARKAVAEFDAAMAQANQALGALQEQQRLHREGVLQQASLRDLAGRRDRVLAKLEVDRASMVEWTSKTERVRAAAGIAPRVGLVHDLARELRGLIDQAIAAGGCDLDDAWQVIEAYEKQHGTLDAEPTDHDVEMAAKLPQYEQALKLSQSAVANGERDLAASELAASTLAALTFQADVAADALDAAQKSVDAAKAERAQHQAELQRLQTAQQADKLAAEKAARASVQHQAVAAWTAISDALSPGGIPGEILSDALGPLNDRLMASALATEWMRVGVGPDMEITVGSAARPYALLSESEKWRADAMLAEAIAHLSGLRLLVLDRFDVLDLQGRSDLFGWLDQLAEDGELDTALVFGTLKSLPAQLPPTICAHWLEAGVSAQLKEAA